MIQTKQDQLNSAVTKLKQLYGSQAIMPGKALLKKPSGIPTGFDALDHILGLRGIPLNAITVLSGESTSGKRTVAYKILANAQRSESNRKHVVAVFDLNATLDADYLLQCGVDMDWLTLIRPYSAKESINVLLDIARSRQVHMVLLDDLNAIWGERGAERYLESTLPQLKPLLQSAGVILLSELSPGSSSTENRLLQNIVPMISLHIAIEHVCWSVEFNNLLGYQAKAQIMRDPRSRPGQSTLINIELPQTTLKRETW